MLKESMEMGYLTYVKKAWNDENIKKIVINAIKSNQLIITSTDTVFGFLTQISRNNFEKLNLLKKRPDNKPYLILIKDIKNLSYFVDHTNLTPQIISLLKKCWPGPVTIIFRAKKNLPSFLISKTSTIALRSPQHTGLQKILTSFKGLFSTSANKSGKPFPQKESVIDPFLLKECTYLVNDPTDTKKDRKPSSIIDLSHINCTNSKITGFVRIIRKGSFPILKLEEYYGSTFKG